MCKLPLPDPPLRHLLLYLQVRQLINTYEQQFHYGVFYAYMRLREQEIRNIMCACCAALCLLLRCAAVLADVLDALLCCTVVLCALPRCALCCCGHRSAAHAVACSIGFSRSRLLALQTECFPCLLCAPPGGLRSVWRRTRRAGSRMALFLPSRLSCLVATA